MAGDRRPRVLVIDDVAQVREIVCECLAFLGYDAQGAADGVEGLTLFDHGGYDLVVTDLVMLGMTGWDVAAAVRQRAPVVLITGSATEGVQERARAEGIPLLLKPFGVDDLKAAAARALRAAHEPSPGAVAVGRAQRANAVLSLSPVAE